MDSTALLIDLHLSAAAISVIQQTGLVSLVRREASNQRAGAPCNSPAYVAK